MRGATRLWVLLLLVTVSDCAVITGACERDASAGRAPAVPSACGSEACGCAPRWGGKERRPLLRETPAPRLPLPAGPAVLPARPRQAPLLPDLKHFHL
ncbi:hypothetical protein QTO34_011084 [Cnephaeus nilssonii]|uniref:Prokineticin domain-containing protein n=1 Tax=Cnephaeus nilssonii TaxID=3371016 RepID=A0AA40HCU9_CNENI|nr:hypothetical protein QTO34_011084 [Eptesicus nilssonii]